MRQQIARCRESGDPSPDLTIDGCSAVIRTTRWAWAFNNRGLAYRRKGDLHHAIADYDQAIGLDPKSATALNNRGIVWFELGESDRAIADYTEAIRLDLKFADAFKNRGFAYIAKGEYDRAIADCTDAIWLDPTAAAYNNRGLAYFAKHDYEHANRDFSIAANKGSWAAMSNIAELYAKGQGVPKDCVSARQWVEKAAAAGLEDAKRYLRSGFDGQCRW